MEVVIGILVIAASGMAAIVTEHWYRKALWEAERRGQKIGFLDGVKSERRFHA